jgi:tRNA-Thr(GGU) m(6)t(6)A37 methyltransferase TsaA
MTFRVHVHQIGRVSSTLKNRKDAPRQPDEGAPPATLVFERPYLEALDGLKRGDEVIVVTWLHRGARDVKRVRPRRDPNRPEVGVFATRSPDRPNPIGLHQVVIESIDGPYVRVRAIEAIDGTPILDVKPVLCPDVDGR